MKALAREIEAATAWGAREIVERADLGELRMAEEELRKAGRARRNVWRVVHAERVRRETDAALERMTAGRDGAQ